MADPFSPYADLAFTAYLRSLGVDEANLQSEVRRRQSAAQRRFVRDAAGLQAQAEKAYTTTRDSFAERGVLNSSQAVRGLSQSAEDYGRQGLELQANFQEDQAAGNYDAVSRLAAMRRDAQEQEFAARGRTNRTGAESLYGGL